MAKLELHERALEMRAKGLSYSQIKDELGVSKSTLSVWLKEYPLSREQINELRGNSERRIERCRETKAKNKEIKRAKMFEKISSKINTFSDRELYLAGIFLYWAEGTKASKNTVHMTNTDPAMLQFFIRWLAAQGKGKDSIVARLHLYADMDVRAETTYWAESLDLPVSSFRKPLYKRLFFR